MSKTMAAKADTKTPPYVSHRTFTNFVNSLRETGIPSRIDTSMMSNLSYGVQASLLASLRYLKLIHEDKSPTEELNRLVGASEKERPAAFLDLLKNSYAFLFDGSIDLNRATAGELDEKFKNATGIKGSTVDKVAAFFLAAASESGIELSPHLKKRKPTISLISRPRKARQSRRRQQRHDTSEPQLLYQLTDILEPNDMTDEEQAAVWTLIRYLKKRGVAE